MPQGPLKHPKIHIWLLHDEILIRELTPTRTLLTPKVDKGFSEVLNTERPLEPKISVVARPISMLSILESFSTLGQVESDVQAVVYCQMVALHEPAVVPLLSTTFESTCGSVCSEFARELPEASPASFKQRHNLRTKYQRKQTTENETI